MKELSITIKVRLPHVIAVNHKIQRHLDHLANMAYWAVCQEAMGGNRFAQVTWALEEAQVDQGG